MGGAEPIGGIGIMTTMRAASRSSVVLAATALVLGAPLAAPPRPAQAQQQAAPEAKPATPQQQDMLKQHETAPGKRYEPELNVLPEQAMPKAPGAEPGIPALTQAEADTANTI